MKKDWFSLAKDIVLALLSFFAPKAQNTPKGYEFMPSFLATGKLGYGAIVTVFVDVIKIYVAIKMAVADGIQITDAVVAWQQYPTGKEVYGLAPVAWKEFLDLDPEESEKAIAEIASATGLQKDEVVTKVLAMLGLGARTYRFVDYTYHEGQSLIEAWKEEVGGKKEVLPTENFVL